MRKLWKSVCAVVLPLCMAVPVLPTAAADSGVRTSAIVYESAGGAIQKALNPGVELHAKVAAVMETGQKEMLFVETLYQNGKLIDIGADRQTVGADVQTVFDASVQLPDDVSGCSVNTSLWDSAEGMNPVCSSSVFPTSENRLKNITVNGAAIEGVTPDTDSYSMAVDPMSMKAPTIGAEPIDGATSIRVEPIERLTDPAQITATGADGSEKEYAVNFTYDTNQLVQNFTLGTTGPLFNWTPTIRKNLTAHSDDDIKYWLCDRDNQFINSVAPEMEGLDYVIGANDWQNGGAAGGETTKLWTDTDANGNPRPHPWYIFEVTRDVTIRVFLEVEKDLCFTEADGWTKEVSSGAPFLVRKDNNGNLNNVTVQYYKTVQASSSVPTEVEINTPGGAVPYIVAFDWFYDETSSGEEGPVIENNDCTLSYIRYDGQLIDGFDAEQTEYEMEGFDPTLFTAVSSSSTADVDEELIIGYPYSIQKYTVTASNGDSREYKVKMRMTTKDTTDPALGFSETFMPAGTQMTYPLVNIPVADGRKKESVILDLQEPAPMSTDRDLLAGNQNRMENINEMLLGMDYVVFENAQSAAWTDASNIQTAISFNITADADVYVAAFTDTAMDEGFEKVAGNNFFQLNWTGCGWAPPFNALYKRIVELNGEDGVTIEIPTPGANMQHYHYVFIDLKD